MKEWRLRAAEVLAGAGIEAASLESQMIVAHVLQRTRAQILAFPDDLVNSLQAQIADQMVSQRLEDVPLAYLLGSREFFGRKFIVNPAVLIPRQETEHLIERALALASGPCRVLDLGTGSGCIAITLKLERPEWNVVAVELSETALQIATQNAEALGAQVQFLLYDGTQPWLGEKFDLLVSNPPYVEAVAVLAAQVRDHEPASALFAGPDGLDFYRAFASVANSYLNPEGHLLLEHGQNQEEAIARLFPNHHATSWSDLAGIKRVLELVPVRSRPAESSE